MKNQEPAERSKQNDSWHPVNTLAEFRDAFVNKPLFANEIRFVIHADGTMTGTIDSGILTGNWYWQDRFFCRTAQLDGEELGSDCETIEISGNQMHYTHDRGNGQSSIVNVG